MERGLGRCYTELLSAENKEKYRADVLYGCLHNLSYDAQSEGTRAGYVYSLTGFFEDRDYFVLPVCEKFIKMSTRDTWENQHLCELLSLFACDGNKEAEAALRQRYGLLYNRMTVKKRFSSYDSDRDAFEQIAVELSGSGTDELLKIIKDIGRLITVNKHYKEYFLFDLFIFSSEQNYTRRRLLKLIREKTGAEYKSFYEAYTAFIKEEKAEKSCVENKTPTAAELSGEAKNGGISPSSRVFFGRAGDDEKKALAEALENEPDENKKAEMLSVFSGEDYPGSEDKLTEYIESDNEKLRAAALSVFEESRSEKLADYAYRLVKEKKHGYEALCSLLYNYKKEYKDTLLNALYSIKTDKDSLHAIIMTINNARDKGVRLPREFFVFVYEKSPCSFCRGDAVRYMSAHRWLTPEIISECRHDSYDDTVKFINRYYIKQTTR